MSFAIPEQAIPVSIYSIKATFPAERDVDGSPLADEYVLAIKPTSDTEWIEYVFNENLIYAFIEELTPYTQYDSKWILRNLNPDGTVLEQNESAVYSFYTRYSERFPLRPPIPAPLYGSDYPTALQAELDAHVNYINTLDDEKAIERLLKEGVGRMGDGGRLITGAGNTTLSITNGWFQSGPGLPSTDARWFPGARLFQIAAEGCA
jgi:hypothetical protein